MPLWHCCGGIFISRLVAGSCPFTYKSSKDMPLVFGKSLYLHTLFFTVISLKTYRIDMSKILIIDDEVQIRTLLTRMMELEGYDVCQAGDCRAALKQLELQNPDVVLCDVFLPDGNGVDLVLAIKKAAPNVEVILLTAHGNIPDGVQAIKNGAFDYITKGDDNNKIIPLISRAVEKARMNVRLEKLEKKVGQTYSFDSILGESKVLKDAVSLAQKVSGTDVPVLLTGETGTGKEVFAQAIHYSSKRARQNFVAVNCSSFSKELLESEMFGHKAGSFTGALKDKKGLFEEANNGTIFLDEIGEMAFELQAKLLRILETGEYIKIGDTKPTRVNVRIIAATNRNLSQEIVAGRFREDLFYRLSVFQIHLPPLRETEKGIFVCPLAGNHLSDSIEVCVSRDSAFPCGGVG
jgi:two-component system NtrC family response regulator